MAIEPYNENEDIKPRNRGRDDWDDDDDFDDDEFEHRDPTLDPGFSSWQDFYNYMYY